MSVNSHRTRRSRRRNRGEARKRVRSSPQAFGRRPVAGQRALRQLG
jgi:hypothetical protein